MPNSPPKRTAKVVAAPPRCEAKPPGPCAMVIFGAGGDLTKRLLVPALYNLSRTGLLPEHFAIVGVDAVDQDAAAWSKSLRAMLQSFVGDAASESRIDGVDDTAWKRLSDAMTYLKGDFNDPGLFEKLHAHLHDLVGTRQTQANVLFTSPSPTGSSARSSKTSATPGCWTRNCATTCRSAGGGW